MSTTPPYQRSVSAVVAIHDGGDRWGLADALLAEVGPGEAHETFSLISDAVAATGRRPLTAKTLRQYRDTALHWPPVKRVPGVSFSAHRVATAADDPRQLISDLVALHNTTSITVPQVMDEHRRRKGLLTKEEEAVNEAHAIPNGVLAAEMLRRISTAGGMGAHASAILQMGGVDAIRALADAAERLRDTREALDSQWGNENDPQIAQTPPEPTGAPPKGRKGDLRGL